MAPAASPSPETISLLQPPAPASPPLHDYTGAPPSLSAPLGAPAHSSPPFLSTPTSSPASPSQVSSPLATPISAPPQPVKSPLPLPPPLANAIPPEVVSFFPLPPALKSPLLPPSSLVVTFPSPPPLPSPPKFPSPPVPLASSTSPPPSPLPIVPPPYLPSPSPQPSSPNSSPKTPWVRPYKIVPLQFANKSLHKIEHSHLLTGLVVGCFLGGVILLLQFGLLYVIRYKFRRTKNPNRLQKDYCKPHCLPPNGAHVITLLPKPLVSPPPPPAISSLESYGSSGSGSVDMKVAQPRKRMLHFSCGTFTYEELEAATNGFSEANLLGQGGFGYVHKGVLRTGKEVAVKKLKNGSLQGEREFQAEVETVSRIHHKHLVSLVGYCLTGAERLVVYEFVSNNTLEFHLHGTGQPIMEWETRLRIAIGSAKGLAYLHEDCHPAIIHRDIKASNILLDSQFEAKVSDFGFAKYLLDNNTHISTRVVGTFGYLTPEYTSSGKLTDKSDVYSYGIMLLELITGRPPINKEESSMSESLVDWARPLLNKALEDGNFHALVDPKLKNNYNCKEMTGMVACAAACVRNSAWLRPRMSQVVRALEGDVSLTKLDDQSGDDTTLSISSTDELSISSIDEQKYH